MSSSDFASLRPLVRATSTRRRLVASSVLLGSGAVLAAAGLLTTSGYLISRAAQRPEILSLTVAIVGIRFFGIARAALRYAERLVSHDLAFRTLADLRARFFRAIVPLVPAGLGRKRRGELLSRFVADVDRLQDLYLRALAPPLVAVATSGCMVVIAALILPAAALVLAAFLLAAGVFVPLVTRIAARASGRRQGPARAALAVEMLEIVGGAPEIALANRDSDWIERANEASGALVRVQAGDAIAGGVGAGLATATSAGAVVAIAAVAIPAIHGGALAGVLLGALVLLAMAAFEGVAALPAAAASLDACATSAGRLEELTDRDAAVTDPAAPRPLGPAGALELRDLRFRYEDGPWVLDGVSLRLEPGRSLALQGASGAGKTTLAELLVRFRDPQEGAVLVGGVDVRDASLDDVRATVRLGAQDAHLFATTIRANLALAKPGAGEAEMRAALAAAELEGWLETLPQGLDTEVGERGSQVSGGQRQRLAAARLFLCDAPFLVFDEPTAHLDQAGARDLLARIAAIPERTGAGVLVITHEPDGLDCFDAVMRLGCA